VTELKNICKHFTEILATILDFYVTNEQQTKTVAQTDEGKQQKLIFSSFNQASLLKANKHMQASYT